jgi:SRSO17 transposase
MASCNIDFSKAREREPAYFVGADDISRRQGIYAPITRDKIMMQGNIEIDTNPIGGAIDALPAVELHMASQSNLEIVWDELVRRNHYLGYQRLLGHRLKYLAFMEERPVAALSFSAPALKLRVRDKYIGWSAEQRKNYLERMSSNSRFLIFPWVKVKNLASHVFALALARLTRDWEERFAIRLWLVETFVDPARFKGTSYRAANWEFIGQTFGSGKLGKGYVYHGSIKEVYVYVLEPRFREMIGCERKSYNLFHRPSPSIKKVEALQMILRHAGWSPDIIPWMKLTETDIELIAEELVQFHKQFHDCFGRKEHRRLGLAYISGLLSNKEAKSVEPIALEFLDEKAVRPLQRFMKSYRWDHEAMERNHQASLSQTIALDDGMITVDSSEFGKKGKESVGVARQYCGALGKVDNCQSGVFVGYSSGKGYGLLTGRLYMPESWFTKEQEQRRKDNLVPEDIAFQTKPQIAVDLIDKIDKTNLFPAKWIGCDATFGSDWEFLESLPQGKYYFAGIRSNTKVFLHKPTVGLPSYQGLGRRPGKPHIIKGKTYTIGNIAKSKRCSWSKVVLAEGAKGPILADVACLRVYPSRNGLPNGPSVWLFLRRTTDGQIKYAFSNAPEDTPLSELCKAAVMRWPIEQCFQDGKSQVGMDHYEHRSWPAWHRHMIYVFLALHFLLRLRIRFKKNSGADITASADTGCGSVAAQNPHDRICTGNCKIPYEEKLCCLSLT